MADTDSCAKYKQIKTEENRANPSKFYTHFLYKALIVSIFLVVLPLFPSQAPEFINQNLLSRSWELLHLLFVGIAVSYGLFSHRNDDIEKDSNNNHSKFDNAQTYVSRFLQVSSFFDDESENSSSSDENKVQTWSSQYYRNEPVVVVAKDHSVLDQEQRGITTSSRIGDKPLLLPVRSLKSRVSDSDNVETNVKSSSISRSSSGSRRYSNKIKNVELGGFEQNVNLEENSNENIVLPSPIPWRSRSGRMEMKEEVDTPGLPVSQIEESEFHRLETRSIRPQMPRSTRPNSTSSSPKLPPSQSLSSPKKLSPSPSVSTESQVKNSEDSVRKKSFYRPPPPPPPPPPPLMHKSSSMKVGSSLDNHGVSLEKDLRRSLTSVQRGVEVMARSNLDGFSMGRSVRTMRDKEMEDSFNAKSERIKNVTFDQTSFKNEPTFMEFPKQDKKEFLEKVIVETDVDSDIEEEDEEDDDDEVGEIPFFSNNEEAGSSTSSDGGPDVDKKADEFIAKFREQIRLQRIESIKRSSAQISRNSSR